MNKLLKHFIKIQDQPIPKDALIQNHYGVFYWIKYRSTPIPQKIFENSSKYKNDETPGMYWIRIKKDKAIPKRILDPIATTIRGSQLSYWIQYSNQDIPNELKYANWKHSTPNPILLWIKYRHNEIIPSELLYDGWEEQIDEELNCPAMYWIRYRKTYFDFNYCIQNIYGETPLIYWIRYTKDPIPNSYFNDNFDSTPDPLITWIIYRTEQFPTCFNHMVQMKDINGMIPIMYDIKYHGTFRASLQFDRWQYISDSNGYTSFIHWMYNFKNINEIPNMFNMNLVNPTVDTKGRTILMHWIRSGHTTIPSKLLKFKSIKDTSGKIPVFYWIKYIKYYIPLELIFVGMHSYRTFRNKTLSGTWSKYCDILLIPQIIKIEPVNVLSNIDVACPICKYPVANPVRFPCNHIMCSECARALGNNCPLDN
jgi:hypothetical protein